MGLGMDIASAIHSEQEYKNLDIIKTKVRAVGGKVIDIEVDRCKTMVVLLLNDVVTVYVPENIQWCGREFNKALRSMYGINPIHTLKVIGGHGCERLSLMFRNFDVDTIDLIGFDTSTAVDMSKMFYRTEAISIKFGGKFTTKNVTDMNGMFGGLYMQNRVLDLSSFDTSKVENMGGMFEFCECGAVINNFDTSNVITFASMFERCKIHKLDLSSFRCKAKLKNDETYVYNKNRFVSNSMFFGSYIDELDVRGFDVIDYPATRMMFNGHRIKKLISDKDSVTHKLFEQAIT